MSSGISFQGLSTNLPTDQLIAAIINQQSQPMVRLQTQQKTNTTKSTALQTLRADLTSLSASLDSLTMGGFQANAVSSTDKDGTYATATASGATAGTYDLAVEKLATRARLVMPTKLQANAPIGKGDYVITDMAGKQVKVTIDDTNNSLAGLAAAINAAKDSDGNASDVNAAVIQTGADGTSQLVLSATNTGQGKNGATTFSIQMAAGSALDPGAQGGFTSTAAGNAKFYLNGVAMERSSNTVSDAVAGVTFTLNGEQTDLSKTTTFTVSQDKDAAAKAMQDVVDKFNTLYNDYKSRAKFTANADGSYTRGVFNMDMTVRNLVTQVQQALMGGPSGLSATARYQSPSSVGVKTNQDGTLSLDTAAFKEALGTDPGAVANLFNNSGVSSNPLLSFVSSGGKTTNSPISYTVSTVSGKLTGTFSSTLADGTTQTNTLTATDGYFYGATGTALEGLVVKAQEGATGTLQVSTGVSRIVQDLVYKLSDNNPGDIGGLISDLGTQNYQLQLRINQQQDYLDKSKASLEKLYANLETTVGSLQSAGQSLSGL